MEIDKRAFIQDYVTEARENLDTLDDLAIQIINDNRNSDYLKEVLRILHTLKGSSRMLEFFQIEKLLNTTETLFKNIQSNQVEISISIAQLLMSICSAIRTSVDKISKEVDYTIENYDFIILNINKAIEGEPFSVNLNINKTENSDIEANIKEVQNINDSKTIKVQISQIDTILQSLDKLIMRQIKLKTEISALGNQAKGENYKNLAELSENMEVLERQSVEIQKQIITLRMLPFDMILQPIKVSIVQEAIKCGKNVDFDIPHSEITIDKAILEKLPPILIHLARNSLDHGIESIEERIKKGKSEQGHLSIKVSQVSNRIFVSISDDGRGIDYEKIRSKAVKLYPERENEITLMDETNLLQFIFASGFSTKDEQTELSGRGIGLDVVRSEIEKLKGKVSIETEKDKGTTFELSLPSSLATQDGLLVKMGSNSYLILSHYIKEIVTVQKTQFLQLQHGPVINVHNQLIPVYDFDSITGKITQNSESLKEETPVVVIEYLNKKIGIKTDEILHYSTVVIKPLPPILKNFEALQGVIFDDNYKIIPVLNIPDAMRRFKSINIYDVKNLEVQKKRKVYSILVVDDSHTTRHIEQIILEAENYKVSTACDGIEALEKMKQNHFDLVITDVKMPRMDGFVLIHNMRHTENLKNIPVIVISSVFESDTKEKVSSLGAQGYIVKSDFERENLVEKVRELLNER
ncbi:MAG: response regulator [Treponema sp.]|nr:response regulator [Treponema sp.]